LENPGQLNAEKLISALQSGSKEALEGLYAGYREGFFRWAGRRFQAPRQDFEDAWPESAHGGGTLAFAACPAEKRESGSGKKATGRHCGGRRLPLAGRGRRPAGNLEMTYLHALTKTL